MLKFLRKYNKWVLVVAACFLMVAFLAPQAIQQWGRNLDKRVVGRIGDQAVRVRDLRDAGAEASLAELALIPGLLDEREKTIHWLLLRTEAERSGFMASTGDGRALVDELASQIGYEIGLRNYVANEMGLPLQFLAQFRAQIEPQWRNQWLADESLQAAYTQQGRRFVEQSAGGIATDTELYESMARIRGVQRMIEQWTLAGALSDRRALREIKEAGREAWARAVFLPASDLAAGVPEPTDDELVAHYERFSAVTPDDGEFGFGYTLPARIKFETLLLDRSAIEDAITPDAIEVRKLWQSQKAPAGSYPADFAAAKPAVEADLKAQIADRVIDVARQAIGAALLPGIRELDSEGRYRVVTDAYRSQRPSLADVAQAVRQQVAEASFPLASGGTVDMPAPVVTIHDRWLTADEIAQLPAVGRAAMQLGGGRLSLAQALFQVRELAGENVLALQQGLPAVQTPANLPDGSLVYFTVLDTRPQSPPDSMEEIRDRVLEDLRTLRAYEALKSSLDEYRSLAVSEGLDAAAQRFAEARADADPAQAEAPPPTVFDEVRFTPQTVLLSQLGVPADNLNFQEVRDAVLSAADTIDPSTPLDAIDAGVATVATTVDSAMGLAIVRILAPRPVTREQLRAQALGYTQLVMSNEFAEVRTDENPFSLAALTQRLKYVDLEGSASDEEQDAAAGDTTAPQPAGAG
ncbi:MAG: hypothetical protein ACF8SC_00025 [Phycisphaerales bacterium JB037]